MVGVVEARELPEVLDRRLQRGDVQRRGLQYGGCAGVRIEIGAAAIQIGTLEDPVAQPRRGVGARHVDEFEQAI